MGASAFSFLSCLVIILLISSSSEADVVTIDVHATRDLIFSGHNQYLDVRTKEEFEKGHVDVENILNIPYMFETPKPGVDLARVNNPEFMEQVLSAFSKDNHIVVGCQRGIRSVYATAELLKAGFKNVSTWEGVMSGWRKDFLSPNQKQ